MVSLSVVVLDVTLWDDDRVAMEEGQVVVFESLKEVLGLVKGLLGGGGIYLIVVLGRLYAVDV